MKIHNLILILPLFLFLNNINAQEVIIGKDSVKVEGLPFVDGDYYSYSQTIYNQKYIHAIGNITKISYYYNGGDTYSDSVSIYMGHTIKSAFSGDDYIPVDSLILVYDGLFSATTEGWAEIELDLSFSYNNIDNLVIAFDDNTRNYHNGDFYCTALDDENYKSIFYRSYDDLNPADMSFGYETKYIPNIKIEGSLTITDHFYILGDTNRQISTDYNSTVIYNIETNASDFTVTCSAAWLDLNYDTGAKTVTLTSNSPVNTISESRTANIVISSNGFDDINANVTQSLFEETQIDLPEVLAGSIEFGDYDRDGDLDFLYTQSYSGYPEIYENSLNIFNTINAGLIEASYGDATWGDYDNDGDLDFAIAGKDGSGNLNTKIYQNKGNSVFDTIPANLMGLYNGSLDWGDYDNDGDLDLLVTGADASPKAYSILYRNDGGNIFVDAEINIPACRSGSVEWGDYNNDNILDILMSGVDINGNRITTILKNNGPGSSEFTDIQAGLKGLSNNSVSWGDYDLDGDLDILISGDYYEYSSLKYLSAVYRNDGNDIFTNINAGLIDVLGKGAAWGDYDNDGDLDIFLAGYYRTSDYSIIYIFKIYQNQGNDLFIETDALSEEFSINKITLGDYDGDSDLDILCTGSTTENRFIKIYRNNINIVNTEPEMPDGLSTTVQDDNVILSWNPSTDAETHSKGLTYNIGFGTENDSFNIVSPMVDTLTGYRKCIPAMGNAMLDTNYLLTELDTGMYYWTVQSVDNGFLSSDFHEIDSFIVVPTFTDSEISLQKGYGSSVAWGDYDNDGDLDIAIIVVDQETDNEYSKIYRNDRNNYFVDIMANITDIFIGTVNWGDYDNDGDLDLAITGRQGYISDTIISTIYRNDGDDNFEDIGAQLKGMYDGFVEWGDLDNDGDLDLLSGGFPQLSMDSGSVTIIYRNDGHDIFTEIETEIPGVGRSFADISDYDNDGDMDIIISGKTGTFPLFTFITKIYRNDDNFSFTDINAGLTGVNDGSVEWGDYDNDGHLDILITGYDDASNKILKIYHNDGNDSFTEIYINTRGVATGNATWGDYDNDGFLDILVAGYSGNPITKIYRNNRNGDFNEIITSIPGVANSSVAWGNYDNDSDLDIIISGGWQTFQCTKIFINNTNYPNDHPSSPTNLQTENWGYGIKLMWDKASDNQGEENGLSYNVRIGATSNGIEIMSPASRIDSTYNLIPKMGNVQTNTSWRIDSLAEGIYYWSVQAVDQSFAGGSWTPEQSFTISVVRADFATDTVCFNAETTFTDKSLSSGDPIIEWKWNFGDGNISALQNPVHTFAVADTFAVQLIAISSQYSDTITKDVIVKPKPAAGFIADIACQGTSTNFTNNTLLNGTTVTDWNWDFGDGSSSTLENPSSHGYLNSGDYNVKLAVYADNGCSDSIQNIVTVANYPIAAITSNLPLEFCEGDSTILSVDYDINYSYQWMLNDADITDADSSEFTAKLTGNYKVEIVNNTGNCTIISSGVDVNAESVPSSPFISYTGNTTFCQGDSIELSVTNNTSLDYQWKLNDGAIGIDTNVYYAKSSGNYTLEVSNSAGCVALSSNSVDVTVNEVPDKPIVSLSGLTGFCEGDSLILSADEHAGLTYQWWNENGEILNANNNQYVTYNSGNFYLNITNSSNCSNTSNTTNVTVSEMPLKPVINTTGYDINDCPQEKVIILSVDQPTVQYDYQWQRNGVPIDGETGSTIEDYLNEGDYSVIADNNGCANESDITGIYYDPELPEKPGIIAMGPNVWYLACTNDKAQQYKWYYNNEIITGANEYLYVANQILGTYFVRIAEENGCFVSSDAVTIPLTATGINDVNPFTNLKIYPNPTPGMFTIEMDNQLYGELFIFIYTQEGKEVLNIKFYKNTQHFKTEVDLSGQGSGLYVILLSLDDYKTERKLIIE